MKLKKIVVVVASESALRERKRSKRILEKGNSKNEFPPESPGEQKTPLECSKTTSVESSIEKVM